MAYFNAKVVKGGKQVKTTLSRTPIPTHKELGALLREAHSISPAQPIRLGWIDEDGEKVMLTNDNDVAEFWPLEAHAANDQPYLRFYVTAYGSVPSAQAALPLVATPAEFTPVASIAHSEIDDEWHAVRSFKLGDGKDGSDTETLSDLLEMQDAQEGLTPEPMQQPLREALVAEITPQHAHGQFSMPSDLNQPEAMPIPLPPSSHASTETAMPSFDSIADHPDINNLRTAYTHFMHTLTGSSQNSGEAATLSSSLFDLVNSATDAATQAYGLADMATRVVRDHARPFGRQASQELGSVCRVALTQFWQNHQARIQERIESVLPRFDGSSPTLSNVSLFDQDIASTPRSDPPLPISSLFTSTGTESMYYPPPATAPPPLSDFSSNTNGDRNMASTSSLNLLTSESVMPGTFFPTATNVAADPPEATLPENLSFRDRRRCARAQRHNRIEPTEDMRTARAASARRIRDLTEFHRQRMTARGC